MIHIISQSAIISAYFSFRNQLKNKAVYKYLNPLMHIIAFCYIIAYLYELVLMKLAWQQIIIYLITVLFYIFNKKIFPENEWILTAKRSDYSLPFIYLYYRWASLLLSITSMIFFSQSLFFGIRMRILPLV